MAEQVDFRSKAVERERGHWFEDFGVGREFVHHWGRTITESENALFTTLTLHFNPTYFNAEYAREHGHPGVQVNPMLVFSTVFGLSVEDLSENGTAFLGIENLMYGVAVYPGDTLTAASTVTAVRESAKKPSQGIATWQTRGYNQRGELVIDFERSNLVFKRAFKSGRLA